MVCVAWVFFRAESVGEALQYIQNMVYPDDSSLFIFPKRPTFYIGLMITCEWIYQRVDIRGRQNLLDLLLVIASIASYSHFILNEANGFIYFQF